MKHFERQAGPFWMLDIRAALRRIEARRRAAGVQKDRIHTDENRPDKTVVQPLAHLGLGVAQFPKNHSTCSGEKSPEIVSQGMRTKSRKSVLQRDYLETTLTTQ